MCQSQPMGTLLGSPRSNHSCPERNFQNAIITQTRMCNKSSDTVIPGVQIKYSLKCLILSESRPGDGVTGWLWCSLATAGHQSIGSGVITASSSVDVTMSLTAWPYSAVLGAMHRL